ncbi:MAG: hypothetical protein ACOYZ7_16845 [Chloroflexota bacterium]
MRHGGRLLGLTLALAAMLLSACGRRDLTAQTEIDLAQILPASLRAKSIQRLDPAAGITRQWLVLYEYDFTGEFSPIAGVVYRADRGGSNRPPVVYPYPLQLPDRDYLGTDQVTVEPRDVLTAQPGAELVVENRNAAGFVTEAAIFRWHDPFADEVWRDHNLEERYYECMGFFRSNGQVTVGSDLVTVEEWVGDRSQLARIHTYKPDERGSYLVDGITVRAAERSYINFAFGQSTDILASPYPEKIVLAFYNALGGPTEALKPYLSQAGQELLGAGLVGYGCVWPPSQVARASVYEISYYPGVETQARQDEARRALVELKVQCWSRTGQAMPEEAHVGWFLVREKGNWRMDQVYRPAQ